MCKVTCWYKGLGSLFKLTNEITDKSAMPSYQTLLQQWLVKLPRQVRNRLILVLVLCVDDWVICYQLFCTIVKLSIEPPVIEHDECSSLEFRGSVCFS